MGYLLAFEVKTPNRHNDRICSIGLSRIENGREVGCSGMLINPECSFEECNSHACGVTSDLVVGKPNFKQFWDKVGPLFLDADCVITQHADFDLGVLARTLDAYGVPAFDLKYIDVFALSSYCFPALPKHQLEQVAKYLKIDFKPEDAASDAHACALIYCKAIQMGLNLDYLISDYHYYGFKAASLARPAPHHHEDTGSLESLIDLLADIIEDGVVDVDELMSLTTWMAVHADLCGQFPYNLIDKALEQVLEDNIIEPEELEWMYELFKTCVHPVESHHENRRLRFKDKQFCLSGEFKFGSTAKVEALIEALGGEVQPAVQESTDYVVVGALCHENESPAHYSDEVKAAIEWQMKGSEIRMICESDFIEALKAASKG